VQTGHAEHQVKDVIDTIKALKREKDVVVSSYDPAVTALLQREGKKLLLGWDTFASEDYTRLKDTNFSFFMLPYQSYEPFIVNHIHGLKKKTVTYTVNNVQDLQKIYNMGIRYIMTDNVPMVIERLRSTSGKGTGQSH